MDYVEVKTQREGGERGKALDTFKNEMVCGALAQYNEVSVEE